MKISIVSNYPPTKCGIAIFTLSLYRALSKAIKNGNLDINLEINAFSDKVLDFPPEVTHRLNRKYYQDYLDAAEVVNSNGTDVCILQHEFGIYSGEEGVYILPFVHQLRVPLVITMHTVLIEPNYTQKFIIEELTKKANQIIVMSEKAILILKEKYRVASEKIILIEHGIPQLKVQENKLFYRDKLKFNHKNIILTFGLISRNKGIEVVIKALPKIIKKHPDTLFIIAGSTHPKVLEFFGEEYREYLTDLANELGVKKNVLFIDRFIEEQELLEYLNAADIFITPYVNEAQITSGALSYAVGAGCIAISTKYWHAQEILSHDRGILFDFNDYEGLSKEVNHLLEDPERMKLMRINALTYGNEVAWPKIGKKYIEVAEFLNHFRPNLENISNKKNQLITLPSFDLQHIYNLTDDTGMAQHAKYNIPNMNEGYCVDDNARALILAIMTNRFYPNKDLITLINIYLKFLYYMKLPDGNFRNFMAFDRSFLDKNGSEDSFGRTMWALGYLIKHAPNNALEQFGIELFEQGLQHIPKLNMIRGKANSLIALSYYLDTDPNNEGILFQINQLGSDMVAAFNHYAADSKKWHWFESELTYDNAILPFSLLLAYEKTKREEFFTVALKATKFLELITLNSSFFIPIGNAGWFKRTGMPAHFDQQPIEAMGMILLFQKMYNQTKKTEYLNKMIIVYKWFLGENILRLPLYDLETKGCCDGLTSSGLNRNQGAESCISYWISHLCVSVSQEETRKKQAFLKTRANII